MKIYLVGGAVRDELLGLPVKERDWLVVGGTEEIMLEQGFRPADSDFPVFLHPETGDEYALARTEVKSGSGYKGFEVDAGPHVTLEQDLIRRDLTVNALARDDSGKLTDLFNGQGDLENRCLRHISPAFIEDPLRLLRTARFAARIEFEVDPETMGLMGNMAASGELSTMNRERVWKEMHDALTGLAPWRFFQVLEECNALDALRIPAIDTGELSAALERISCNDPVVRFAVAMYGATASKGGSGALEDSLALPVEQARLLDLLVRFAPGIKLVAEGSPEATLDMLTQLRVQQQPERYQQFIQACEALWPEFMADAGRNLAIANDAMASVSATELQNSGLKGKELGVELARLRLETIRVALQG